MTVPVGFGASMGPKPTLLRIRRSVAVIGGRYCGTAIAVPYIMRPIIPARR